MTNISLRRDRVEDDSESRKQESDCGDDQLDEERNVRQPNEPSSNGYGSEYDQEDEADEDVIDRWFLEHVCSFLEESLYPKSGYSAELPAVDLTITARDKALLNTNNVLHPAVRTPANKAGGENNSEDENSALDDRNDDASHEGGPFKRRGFNIGPVFFADLRKAYIPGRDIG